MRAIKKINSWAVIAGICTTLVVLPYFLLTLNVFTPNNEVFLNILQFWLKDYVVNTVSILVFTGLFTGVIGVILSFIFAYYDFPFKKIMQIFVILPLSIPAYVSAYTYSDMFSYTGTIQKIFRNGLGLAIDQKYFSFLNLKGIIFIFTISLYPYVFLLVSSFLKKQSGLLYENARVLGLSPIKILFKVIIPISMPVILSGIILVLMEVLSDYGVSSYFGIHTFATAIFQTWFGMQDIYSAIKVSMFIMILSAVLVFLNTYLRRPKKSQVGGKANTIKLEKLKGLPLVFVMLFLGIVISFSSLIPILQLIHWAFLTYHTVLRWDFIQLILNTFGIAMVATIIIVAIALVVSNANRIFGNKITKLFVSLSSLGYAMPSTVLGLGVLVLFKVVDTTLYPAFGITISGGLMIVVFAYVSKFLAVGIQSIESGFGRVGKIYLENSRMLGYGVTKSFFLVDIFTIKASIVSAVLMIFIDAVKELPLMLMIRPFNFNTLATKVYFYAGDEQIKKAAIPSLLIIGLCFTFSQLIMQRGKKGA